jgi:hypothetical protein
MLLSMKRDFRLPAFVVLGVTICSLSALALTENPYQSIVGRNVFALKAPTAAPVVAPPAVAPAGIDLQGFTTILGRPQVLLKIKLPPKPPEPARDQPVVMDIGERKGEVEVVSIDTVAGIVRLKNQDRDFTLTMKDNAAKPAPGLALPAPPVAGLPPALPAPAAAPGAAIGNPGGGAVPSLPTRTLRSPASVPGNNVPMSRGSAPQSAGSLSAVEQQALIEVQREAHQGTPMASLLPPMQAERPKVNK